MYYILYEGLKIESNEPVYCTLYIVHRDLISNAKLTPGEYNGNYNGDWRVNISLKVNVLYHARYACEGFPR